eukprot:4233490-Pleurochrysis_carterae.AAC.6
MYRYILIVAEGAGQPAVVRSRCVRQDTRHRWSRAHDMISYRDFTHARHHDDEMTSSSMMPEMDLPAIRALLGGQRRIQSAPLQRERHMCTTHRVSKNLVFHRSGGKGAPDTRLAHACAERAATPATSSQSSKGKLIDVDRGESALHCQLELNYSLSLLLREG